MAFSDPGDEELSYGSPGTTVPKLLLMGGAALIFMMLFLTALRYPRGRSDGTVIAGLVALAFLVGTVWVALSLRVKFVFSRSGVTYQQCLGSRWFAYADMAGCTVKRVDIRRARSGDVHGWAVTFLPEQAGVEPLEMFVDEKAPIDGRIVALLRSVPTLDSRTLKVLELATPKRVW